MSKIIGNTTATPVPRSNWAQTEESKADFILNKPKLGGLASKDVATKTDLSTDVQASLNNADVALQNVSELEPLVGTTSEITPMQVAEAILSGRAVCITYTDGTFGVLDTNHFVLTRSFTTIISTAPVYYNGDWYMYELVGSLSDNQWQSLFTIVAKKEDLEATLNSANEYTNEYIGSLEEGFTEVILQMYGNDVPESGAAPTIREIANDETNAIFNAALTTLKGTANGLAELDESGKVPIAQLPSYVDDVLEYSAKSSFPTTGETGKIYVDTSNNKTYRWSGSTYTEISASLALGTTSSTAYRGDRGKTAYDHSQSAHAPANAEKNQNAFSKVAVSGQTTVEAESVTDTLTLAAGSNVTLATDATNDTVTITAKDTTYYAGKGLSLSGTTFNNDAALYYVPTLTVKQTGSSTSNKYLASKWSVANVAGITTPTDGMSIAIRTPAAGFSGGILLSIDNGTTYYPIVRNVNTLVTTTYAQGSTVILTFNATQTASPYTTAGTTSTVTGCWQTADYDANTKNTTGTSNKTGTKLFLVGGASQSSSGVTTYTNSNIYVDASNVLNSAQGFKGKLTGNADTATKATQDGDGNVIVDTYATKSDVSAIKHTKDWNQMDASAPDYIENRTHYVDMTYELLGEREFTETSLGSERKIGNFVLTEGRKYKVTYDSVDYLLIAMRVENDGIVSIGAWDGSTNNYDLTTVPFVVRCYNGEAEAVITVSTVGEHSVSISLITETVYPIDEKFIPDEIPRMSDIPHVETVENLLFESDKMTDYYVGLNGTNYRYNVTNATSLIAGSTYKIGLNNDEYILNAILLPADDLLAGCICVGNRYLYDTYLENTGEPFCVVFMVSTGNMQVLTQSVTDFFSVIEIIPEYVHQLDEKYIPDTIARMEDVAHIDGTGEILCNRTFTQANLNGGTRIKLSSSLILGECYTVTLDGINYIAIAYEDAEGCPSLGAIYDISTDKYDFSEVPFSVYTIGSMDYVWASTTGDHTLIVTKGKINRLDERLLPASVESVIIRSSTEGSTKKFRLTIDDNGTISATEVV